MKPITATIFSIFCLFVMTRPVQAQVQRSHALASVKIKTPVLPTERLNLIALLDLDHFVEEDGYIQTEISQDELDLLKRSGYTYEVLIPDLSAHLREVNRPYFEGRRNGTLRIDGTPVNQENRVALEQPNGTINNIITTPAAFQVWSDSMGGYYTLTRMYAAINNLFNTYSPSGLVDTFHIGNSIEGRRIIAVKISDNAATDEPNEPECFFQGVQHAREAIGGSSMIFMMQYLCEQYTAGNTTIQNLVNNREIFIIVCMNPDGWDFNRTGGIAGGYDPINGGGDWRKNRRNHGGGVFGVDLNRNWSVDWNNCTGAVGAASCGSNNQSSDTYWGTGAFSEPETMAVRNFIRSHNIVVANDQHSVGPYFSLPFGRPNLHVADTLTPMEQIWYEAIPGLMAKYNGMRAGNSVQALGYEVAGGVKDWFARGDVGPGINGGTKVRIFGMTGEGGYGTTGASTFWPPASAIVNLCKGMLYQNLQMMYSAGSYVDVQDNTDIALTSTTGNISFRLRRLGLENQPVTVTATPVTNVSSFGAPVVVTTLNNFYDEYIGNISYTLPASITNGQRIRYAITVQTVGVTIRDTITKFYNPTTVFTDDMETGTVGTKWTVSAGWNYVIDSGYAATRALTESPGGKYPANVTTARTALCRTTFNLTGATAAYLTFQTMYRAENFRDKLQIQVSTNGSTWTAVPGKFTVREPGTVEGSTINGQPALTGVQPSWVNEVFDLSAVPSVLGQPSVQIRFAFTSNAASTFWASEDEGFYIDNVKVITSNAVFVTLGANFLSFDGRLLNDNTAELKWEASVDAKHAYFEVEKSADRNRFVPIGRINPGSPFKLIDRTPLIGNNFYRIKEVDVDGKETYSRVINIVYNPAVQYLQVYPNPVKNVLNVRLKISGTDQLSLQVTDMNGHIIRTQNVAADNSIRDYAIDIRQLASNVYTLKVINSKNEVISVQKFMKQ